MLFALLITLVTSTGIGFAVQQGATPPAPDPQGVRLAAGTKVLVALTDGLSSKTHMEDERIKFTVVEDVLSNGQIVIAKGAAAAGRIKKVAESERFGKGGRLAIEIETVKTVDGQSLKLYGFHGVWGKDRRGAVIGWRNIIGGLAGEIRGKEAKINPGTQFEAFTDEEITVKVTTSK